MDDLLLYTPLSYMLLVLEILNVTIVDSTGGGPDFFLIATFMRVESWDFCCLNFFIMAVRHHEYLCMCATHSFSLPFIE